MENQSQLNQQNLNDLTKGFQVLREYVFYNGFNIIQWCKDYDPKNEGKINKDKFRDLLKKRAFQYYFTSENIEEIIIDAPKHDKGQIIDYIQLSKLIKSGPKPTTSYSMINSYCAQVLGKTDDKQIEIAQKAIEDQKLNFFDRQDNFEFEHFDLTKLDCDQLKSVIPGQEISSEDQQQQMDDIDGMTAEEQEMKRKLNEFNKVNNEYILCNLDTKVAKEMIKVIKPQIMQELIDEQIENLLKERIGMRERKTTPFIHSEQFCAYIKNHFKTLQLTKDESELIYYRIWKSNQFKEFTVRTWATWIDQCRKQRIKELIKAVNTETEARRTQQVKFRVPRLFKELVKFQYSYGASFLEKSLAPLIEKEDLIDLGNLRLYFNSLQLSHSDNDINELKFYLAANRVIVLEDYHDQNYLKSALFLKQKELINLIQKEISGIVQAKDKSQEKKQKNKEQARDAILAKIIEGVLAKIQMKFQVFCDEHDFIEELKLRQIIAEMFPDIDQQDLDSLFNELDQKMEPTKYMTQLKIYVPEFIGLVKSGPLFEAELQQKQEELQNLELNKQQSSLILKTSKQQSKKDEPQPEEKQFDTVKFPFGDRGPPPIVEQPKQLVNPLEGGFVYHQPTQAFKVRKLNDQTVLQKMFDHLQQKFIVTKEDKNTSIFKQIDKIFLEFRNLLAQKDPKHLGTIPSSEFYDLVNQEFVSFSQEEKFYLKNMAEKMCGAEAKEDYADLELSYSFFCVNLHQYFAMSKLIQN